LFSTKFVSIDGKHVELQMFEENFYAENYPLKICEILENLAITSMQQAT
jgi:hypothetical protein